MQPFVPVRDLVHRDGGWAARWARGRRVVGVVGAATSMALAGCGSDVDHGPKATTSAAATTPAAATIVPSHANPDAFLQTACPAAELAEGTRIGIGLARPTRVLAGAGPEADAYAGMVRCLRGLHGGDAKWRPLLRTQLPIDALRRLPPAVHEAAELNSFAQLLQGSAADGIVSIRSHDFTRCGRGGNPAARERGKLAAGEALRPCEYPSPALYKQLFTELRAAVTEAAPGAELWWTAWNEPDHPAFTLTDAFGTTGAARQAGRYWREAAAVAGAERVLGGEFADRTPQLLAELRKAFVQGAGEEPKAWAIHPYRDLTRGDGTDDALEGGAKSEQPERSTTPTTPPADGPATLPGATTPSPLGSSAMATTDAFSRLVAPAPAWLTEFTPLLSSRRGISGDVAAQRAAGERLRAHAGSTQTIAALYLLVPPPAPKTKQDDGWDSALADRQGRARPFICGLAGLPAEACSGSPDAFGG